MTVEIYSDIACPWCYIGERRFSRALAAFPQADQLKVVFRPYQLDPSLPDEPQPLQERLRRKFGQQTEAMVQHVTSVAEKEGLAFRLDEAQAVNTFAAHRVLRLAEQEAGPETQRKLAGKLFEAYFVRGENIDSVALLADLSAEVGMDRDRTATYLASDEDTEAVRRAIERAQRLGIRAVPTFVFDGESAVQGAQPTSVFLQALEEQYAATPTAARSCADGACST